MTMSDFLVGSCQELDFFNDFFCFGLQLMLKDTAMLFVVE